MASRTAPPSKPERPFLTVEQKRRCIDRLGKRIEDLQAFDPQTVQKRFPPEVTALQNAIDEALSVAFGHGTVEYRRYSGAAHLDDGTAIVQLGAGFRGGGQHDETHRARQILAEGKRKSIVLLQQAIRTLQDEITDQEHEASSVPPMQATAPASQRKVFIVHGHDDAALQAVARFLEKLRLEAIVLREQPDQGRTIIEKFEDYASEVGFAVVLLTPDDLAGAAATPSQTSRARQNVIFELGYFVGKLGRGRACLLRKGEVEIPSDLYGVIYSEMDAGEGWKLKLAREFAAAKLDFDGGKAWA
jgi:predicted nucleotide-binding protein